MKPKRLQPCKAVPWILALLLTFSSCTSAPPDYYAYRECNFCAELQGVRENTAFTAKMTVETLAQGYEVSLEYLSPEALKGITVTGCCNADGALIDAVEIKTNGLLPDGHEVITSAAAQGLLTPATAWLCLRDHTAVVLEKEQYRLDFANGEKLLLDLNGQPIGLMTKSAEFWIVWWENGEKKAK